MKSPLGLRFLPNSPQFAVSTSARAIPTPEKVQPMKMGETNTAASPQRRTRSSRPSDEISSSADETPRFVVKTWMIGATFLFLLAMILIIAAYGGMFHRAPNKIDPPSARAIPAQYDADRAFGYLKTLCEFGPRPSGSNAMGRQQQYLKDFFIERGAQVTFQTFEIRHPQDGSPVSLANLIASWHPDRPKRYLFCAHYDTRPFPDRDRFNKRGTFVGANDGASGTAALMELAHQLGELPSDVGVDIVLFDGEEFVFEQGRDDYFLGSTFFAEKYAVSPPAIKYTGGILLDMIGDRELKIYYEQNSMRYARNLCKDIWKVADKLNVIAFVPRVRHKIDDDHIPLNQIAKIPTVDLIDFDYPRPGVGAPSYWHTEQDVPENCSGESMAAVVWVVHQWLQTR